MNQPRIQTIVSMMETIISRANSGLEAGEKECFLMVVKAGDLDSLRHSKPTVWKAFLHKKERPTNDQEELSERLLCSEMLLRASYDLGEDGVGEEPLPETDMAGSSFSFLRDPTLGRFGGGIVFYDQTDTCWGIAIRGYCELTCHAAAIALAKLLGIIEECTAVALTNVGANDDDTACQTVVSVLTGE